VDEDHPVSVFSDFVSGIVEEVWQRGNISSGLKVLRDRPNPPY